MEPVWSYKHLSSPHHIPCLPNHKIAVRENGDEEPFFMGADFLYRWAGGTLKVGWQVMNIRKKSNYSDESDVPRCRSPHACFCILYRIDICTVNLCQPYIHVLCWSYMSIWKMNFFILHSVFLAFIEHMMSTFSNPWTLCPEDCHPVQTCWDSPRKCVPLQTWSPRRFLAPWLERYVLATWIWMIY